MMKTIGRKIFSILTLFLVLILVSNLFSIKSLSDVNKSNRAVSDKYLVKVTELGEIAKDYQAVQKYLNSHLVTFMEQEKASIEEQITASSESFKANVLEYSKLTDESDLEKFTLLFNNITKYFEIFDMVVERSKSGDNYGSFQMMNTELGPISVEIEELIDELIDINYAAVNDAKNTQNATVRSSYVVIIVSIVVLVALMAV